MRKLLMICPMLLLGISDSVTAQTEATFYTTKGAFTVQLYDTLAPVTVDSFIARVAEQFYDGLIFHRVIDGFMIQGGDPKGNGTGDAGYKLPDEFSPEASNVQKTISMANSGPNTGSCQFFINLVNNTGLDYNKQPTSSKHPVFGIVINNFSVVQDIGKTPTTGNKGTPPDKPLTDMVMDSVRITRFSASVPEYYAGGATINIYPNPTTDVFNINLPDYTTEVVVTDISGKVIAKVATEQLTKLSMDMSGRSKGIYLVRVINDKGTAYGRIVLQ